MKTCYYMDILKCIVNRIAPSEETVGNLSLEEVYKFSGLNKMIPLTADLLTFWKVNTPEEQNLVTSWKAEAMRLVFEEQKKLYLIKQLAEKAEKEKLKPVFFKGYLLAELYQNFALRTSSDTDILITEADRVRTDALLSALGYRPAKELDTKNVYTFVYVEEDEILHKIELHTVLYDDVSEAEQMQLEELRLYVPETLISVKCCGLELRTLPYTEHLIYQLVHMVKHLCCHGFPARYFMDTALFIRRYEKEIHWEKVQKAMECLGYDKFYGQLLSILVREFELPERILDGIRICSEHETEELMQDILRFGARSFGSELSGGFYYFEKYVEKLEAEQGKMLSEIRYDGTTVPLKLVPIQYQQSEQLQNRICLLQKLRLI